MVHPVPVRIAGLIFGKYDGGFEAGRLSIVPKILVHNKLVEMLYSISLTCQLIGQNYYKILYRWARSRCIEGTEWVPTVHTKKRRYAHLLLKTRLVVVRIYLTPQLLLRITPV